MIELFLEVGESVNAENRWPPSRVASRVGSGCVPGSVPPFGSIIGLPTYVDVRLAENEIIHFNAGSLTDSVRMPYKAYIEIEKPIVSNIAK